MMDRAAPPFKHTWLKSRDPLPDNPEVHLALLAYMPIWTSCLHPCCLMAR